MASESMKQAASRPRPPLPRPASGSGLDHFLPILPRVRLQVVADELLDAQVDDVVDQRAADQELHRQVVDPLGVLPVVRLLGQQPALGEQIAQRAGDRLEALALAGVLHGDDMVEDQVPVVVVVDSPCR